MSRAVATELLTHYLRTVWEAAALVWLPDNDAEVESIVNALAGVADEAANEAVRAHRENEPHIYPDGSTA